MGLAFKMQFRNLHGNTEKNYGYFYYTGDDTNLIRTQYVQNTSHPTMFSTKLYHCINSMWNYRHKLQVLSSINCAKRSKVMNE
jgi:hypothetical protein